MNWRISDSEACHEPQMLGDVKITSHPETKQTSFPRWLKQLFFSLVTPNRPIALIVGLTQDSTKSPRERASLLKFLGVLQNDLG